MSKGFQLIRPMVINDAALLSSNVADPNYTAWAVGMTYAKDAFVTVTATNLHKVYQSLVASNTGNDPTLAASSTKWVQVGSTNRGAMFDGSVSSQTTNADSIAVSFRAVGRIDSIGLLNVVASSVTVTMTDATDGLVYNKTVSLVSTSGVIDWYTYFFEPVVLKSDIAFTDLPLYGNALITVTLNNAGSAAACGACVLGLSKILGSTQYGAKLGIVDYSTKQTDGFGNTTILQRVFSKRGTYTVWIDAASVDQTAALLASYRATPILYIGAEDYAGSILYGYFKDFEVDISYPSVSVCSIQLEGLT